MTSIIVLDSSDEETEPTRTPVKSMKGPPVAPLQQKLQQPLPPPPPQLKQPPPPPIQSKPKVIELPRKSPISIVRLDKLQQKQQQPSLVKRVAPNNSALVSVKKKNVVSITTATTPSSKTQQQATATTSFPTATISTNLRAINPLASLGITPPSGLRIEKAQSLLKTDNPPNAPQAGPSLLRLETSGTFQTRVEKTTTNTSPFRIEKPATTTSPFRIEKVTTCTNSFRVNKPATPQSSLRIEKAATSNSPFRMEKPASNPNCFQTVYRLEKPGIIANSPVTVNQIRLGNPTTITSSPTAANHLRLGTPTTISNALNHIRLANPTTTITSPPATSNNLRLGNPVTITSSPVAPNHIRLGNSVTITSPPAVPNHLRMHKSATITNPSVTTSQLRLVRPPTANTNHLRLEKPATITSPPVVPSNLRLEKLATITSPPVTTNHLRLEKPATITSPLQMEKPAVTITNQLQLEKSEALPTQLLAEKADSSVVQLLRNCLSPDKPEACSSKSSSRSSTPHQVVGKRKVSESSENDSEKSMKRIKPTQISDKVDKSWVASQSPVIAIDDDDKPPEGENTTGSLENGNGGDPPSVGSSKDGTTQDEEDSAPVHPTYLALLDACRTADPGPDMEKLINKKLLRYYHSVHPDFVVSKGFRKTVKAVTEEIKSCPGLVYYKLRGVVEELKVRRKCKETLINNEEITSTGNEKTDLQVKKLSKALYIITKKIAKLEEAEVDFSDDLNSTYLQVERYKKRACEIYNMICDLTGESKHAHRSVKKPIMFRGTSFPEFNKTLQSFVNRTKTFPDFYDVYRCLEHCNAQYCLGLKNDQIKSVAQDAFIKIGKLLQDRRKSDLYETVAHFTGSKPDPAESDPMLNAKLHENQRHHVKISTILEKYAKEQDIATSESEKNKSQKECKLKDSSSDPTQINSTEETGGKDKKTEVKKEDVVEINELVDVVPKSSDLSSKPDVSEAGSKSTEDKKKDSKAANSGELEVVAEIIISDEET